MSREKTQNVTFVSAKGGTMLPTFEAGTAHNISHHHRRASVVVTALQSSQGLATIGRALR